MEPVGAQHDLAAQGNENDQENEAAPAAPAWDSAPEAKTLLEPIEYSIQ